MYAAAGGASLASRQKRKNQAAQNVKNKALLQQGLKDKLAATRASGLATPTKAQSRQFHNLPPTYLRTPQAQTRKLSAGGYTNAQSRLLLPINESNPNLDTQHHNYLHHQQQNQQLHHPTHQQQIHQQQHFQQQLHSRTGRGGSIIDHPCTHNHPSHPCPQHPHHYNNSRHHLPKSATLPIVSQSEATPPATPTTTTSSTKPIALGGGGGGTATGAGGIDNAGQGATGTCSGDDPHQQYSIHIQVPHHDSIIVTPATPLASPGPATPNHLERKCSFYRGKKLNTFDDSLNKTTTITYSEDQLQYTDEYHAAYNLPNGQQKWVDSDYCDSEHRHLGICTCDHVEVKHFFFLYIFDGFVK